ncbi:MAG: universal stress protein [Chloroflexota bacterium]
MFSRVLFPTDFSTYANAVLDCLPELKSCGMGEVILLSVIRPQDVPLPESLNRQALEYWRWSLSEQLNIATMALEGKGLRVISRVEYGHPAQWIIQVAEEERVSMIVLGAQGLTIAQEILLGSTAYEVLRRASVPVLLVKAEIVREIGHIRCRAICHNLFAHVLHPTDFSPYSQSAFQIVKRLKTAGTKEVTLLHVQDERIFQKRSAEQVAEFDQHDRERLEELAKVIHLYGMKAETILRHGLPTREVLKVADDIGEDCLIVMGIKGTNPLRQILTGSTFENVVRLCRQSVLAINLAANNPA